VKIAVCIKRVPEMDVKFKIAPNGLGVDETGLKWDMSDFDGYAVEWALQTTEKLGQGEVTVVSVGTDAAQETIRKALSMGAARGVLLKTDAVPFDGYAIAQALAAELNDGGYDLILCGFKSIDNSNGMTGAILAELLGLPLVSSVSKLEVSGKTGTARHELEGAAETLEFPLPALVTIDEGIARPRYPSLKGIMAAKKKPLEVKPAQLGPQRLTVTRARAAPGAQGGAHHRRGSGRRARAGSPAPDRSQSALSPRERTPSIPSEARDLPS
jgi:electron transfer flavoprotein beta subunit